MKKFVAIMLALLLVVPLFVSCDENNEESQADESNVSDASGEPSGEVSETASGDTSNGGSDMLPAVGEIDAAFKYDIPENCVYNNIIDANTYTINLESYKNYPDDGKKLTDNDDAVAGKGEKWVGFLGRDDIEITVDLGGLKQNLGGFSINTLYESSTGKGVPKTCEFWISEDGVKFVKIATSAKYPEVLENSQVYTHEAYTQKGFEAAYIKIVLTGFVSQWTLVDGIKVYQVSGKTTSDGYYVNDPMPEDVTPVYWADSEAGYTDFQNLIKGLGQRVYLGAALQDDHKTDYYNTPASSTVLTDGKRGGTNYADAAYFHVTRGMYRYFVYDLGKLSELSKAVVGIYTMSDYGIVYPENISVLLSEDGKNWQTVSYMTSDNFPGAVGSRADVTFDFGGSYKARFIKFALAVSSHTWLDEFEVWGTKKVSNSAKTIVPEETSDAGLGYPSPDSLGGCENILLAYNYKTENPTAGRTTKSGYLPYVGYYDTDGTLKDYFFDSYLYLPCSTVCPSGGYLFSSEKKASIMTDWIDYENDVFFDGANVKALEEAVEEVKTGLGESDYQVKVFLSIFNPNNSCTDFGDVDGDGISENMKIISDRKKVVKWWIDRQLERYNACGFKNQKLVGFYWYDESVDLSDALCKETLLYAINYVHSLGYYMIWIPYNQASGYSQWKNMGFDAANMQPNYMFRAESTEQTVYDNAILTKMLGMGVEIEIDGDAISTEEYHNRYMAYLRIGVEYGYMNSIKMYYQDAGPGVYYAAYASDDPYVRMIYDITYKYAKGTLTLDSVGVTDTALTTTVNTAYKGQITLDSGVCLSAEVAYCPKYGSVSVSGDGKLIYTPMENFIGTDSFIISVSNGLVAKSITYTVNITKQ